MMNWKRGRMCGRTVYSGGGHEIGEGSLGALIGGCFRPLPWPIIVALGHCSEVKYFSFHLIIVIRVC